MRLPWPAAKSARRLWRRSESQPARTRVLRAESVTGLQFEPLESRILLSAEVGIPPPDIGDIIAFDLLNQIETGAFNGELAAELEDMANGFPTEFTTVDPETVQDDWRGPALLDHITSADNKPDTLIFVDSGIDDYETLVRTLEIDATSNVQVILLEADRDGIEQITEYLEQREGIQAIHILSHGNEGRLQLGGEEFSGATVDNYEQDLMTWRNALSSDADILLYGCRIAGGESGIEFIQRLSSLTGADVAASTNDTGSAQYGGDWVLEYTTGEIEAAELGPVALATFDGLLVDLNGDYQPLIDGIGDFIDIVDEIESLIPQIDLVTTQIDVELGLLTTFLTDFTAVLDDYFAPGGVPEPNPTSEGVIAALENAFTQGFVVSDLSPGVDQLNFDIYYTTPIDQMFTLDLGALVGSADVQPSLTWTSDLQIDLSFTYAFDTEQFTLGVNDISLTGSAAFDAGTSISVGPDSGNRLAILNPSFEVDFLVDIELRDADGVFTPTELQAIGNGSTALTDISNVTALASGQLNLPASVDFSGFSSDDIGTPIFIVAFDDLFDPDPNLLINFSFNDEFAADILTTLERVDEQVSLAFNHSLLADALPLVDQSLRDILGLPADPFSLADAARPYLTGSITADPDLPGAPDVLGLLDEMRLGLFTALAGDGDEGNRDGSGGSFIGVNFASAGNFFRSFSFDGADLRNAIFSGVDLAGSIFQGADLRGVNFSGADLTGVDFRGADLRGVDFSGANLFGVDFGGADLRGANLSDAFTIGANFRSATFGDFNGLTNLSGLFFDPRTFWAGGAGNPDQLIADGDAIASSTFNFSLDINFSGVDLTGFNLSGMDLSGFDFTGANLSGVNLRGALLNGANFTGVDLSGALIAGADFSAVTFGGTNISNLLYDALSLFSFGAGQSGSAIELMDGANLSGLDLSGFDFSGLNLSGANFTGAILSGINLSGIDLSGANLSGANLRGADLSDTLGLVLNGVTDLFGIKLGNSSFDSGMQDSSFFSGLDLRFADLTNVDFSGFDLRGVDFRGASIGGLNFSGADLGGVNFSGVDLSGVLNFSSATFSSDFSFDIGTINPGGIDLPNFEFATEATLPDVFGPATDGIEIELGGGLDPDGSVQFDFTLDYNALLDIPFTLDTAALGLGDGVRVDLPGVDFDLDIPISLSGSGRLLAGAAVDIDVFFGLDLSGVGQVGNEDSLFFGLGDDGIRLGVGVAATDLDLAATLGPLSGGVEDGIATLAAGIEVRLVAGVDADSDGRVTLGEANIAGTVFEVATSGGAQLDAYFPLFIELGSFAFPLDQILTQPAVTIIDNNLFDATLPSVDGTDARITLPQLQDFGGVGLYLILNEPQFIFDGLNGILDGLDDLLGSDQALGFSLPFVGELAGAANFSPADFTDPIRSTLGLFETLLTGGDENTSPIGLLQSAFVSVFGSLIRDQNGDSVIDANDVLVEILGDAVEFRIELGPDPVGFDVPLDFSGALPGLGLDLSGAIDVDLDASFDLVFGFSLDDFLYLNTADSGLSIDASAAVDSVGLTGSLGFLELTANFLPVSAWPEPISGVTANGLTLGFGIGLVDPSNDDRLSISELFNTTQFSDLVDATVNGRADFELVATIGFGNDAAFPDLSAGIGYNQVLADASTANGSAGFGLAPDVTFRDVTLDVGTFFSQFVEPIFGQIQDVLAPIQPLVDILQARIPVLSEAGFGANENGDVTFISFAEFLQDTAPGLLRAFNVDYIVAAVELVDLIQSIPTDGTGLVINFGDFNLDDLGVDLRSESDPNQMVDSGMSEIDPATQLGSQGASTETTDFAGGITEGGFRFPLLTSPTEVLNLLLGKNASLFEYDMPGLEIMFDYARSFPVFPGLNARLGGSLEANVNFTFGFDTRGLNQFQLSGDPEDIFNGFYLSDWDENGVDIAEAMLTAGITAGASLGVSGLIEAGVEGGVAANIGFNLSDPNADGRVHTDEFINRLLQGPECLFDTQGALTAGLDAFLWIGLDLGFFGEITIFDESFGLFDVTLIDFNYSCPPQPPPILGLVDSDGVLTLNMGSLGGLRGAGYEATDESFRITQVELDNGTIETRVRFQGQTNTFTGVTTIIADAGAGADEIIVDKSVTANVFLAGGSGDDTLQMDGVGFAVLFGDSGDDTLTGSVGNDYIYGGAGDDRIQGNRGSDLLLGGDATNANRTDLLSFGAATDPDIGTPILAGGSSGVDTIFGGDGNDQIYGGDGADSLSGDDGDDVIWGGDGNDSIRGGEDDDLLFGENDDDRIVGNEGRDRLEGGDGADTLDGGGDADIVLGDGGDDSISWQRGDADDTQIMGGAGEDTFLVTADDSAEVINVTPASAGAAINLSWGGSGQPNLTASGIETLFLDAAGGADTITLADLAATELENITVDLGLLKLLPGENIQAVDDNGDLQFFQRDDGSFILDGNGDQIPVLVENRDLVISNDGAADELIIEGGIADDMFTISNTADTLTVFRPGIMSIAVDNGDRAIGDTVRIEGGAGADTLDASAVDVDLVALELAGEGGDDRLIGSRYADVIDGGLGSDRLTGNAGIDTFRDASPAGDNDTLIESRDLDFALFDDRLVVGTLIEGETDRFLAGTEVEALDSLFESAEISGGSGRNELVFGDLDNQIEVDGIALDVTPWAGSGIVTLDNQANIVDPTAGPEVYTIFLTGTTGARIQIEDSGGTSGSDEVIVFGTMGDDIMRLNAATLDDDSRLGEVIAGVDGPNQEQLFYRNIEQLTINLLAGNDFILLDDNAAPTTINLGDGIDSAQIGTVPTIIDANGIPVADPTRVTNGITVETTINGGDGDDFFEVNHNLASLFLNGDNGDDSFIINTFLTLRDDTSGEITNLTTLTGGGGADEYQYLQNGPVLINGGDGLDTVIVNGTEISDVFIVTDLYIAGAGRLVFFDEIERIKVRGAGGDDQIYVLSTNTEFDTVIEGGEGNDVIHVGGQPPILVFDPPPFIYQPPDVIVQPPAELVFSEFSADWAPSIITVQGFLTETQIRDTARARVAATLQVLEAQPDTNITTPGGIDAILDNTIIDSTFGFSWWSWSLGVTYIYIDPPAFDYEVGTEVFPDPISVTPPPIAVDRPAFNLLVEPTYELSAIRGTLTIDGGDDDGDQLILHDEASTGSSGALNVIELDNGTANAVTGFGLGSETGLIYLNFENLDVRFGEGDDNFTIAVAHDGQTTLNLGGGDDEVTVLTMTGTTIINGGGGDDAVTVDNSTVTANQIEAQLQFDGDRNVRETDELVLDDNGDPIVIQVAEQDPETGEVLDSGPPDFETITRAEELRRTLDIVEFIEGNDSLLVDDSLNTEDSTATLTGDRLTGLSRGDDIGYTNLETLTIETGSGSDVIDVRSTTAETRINTNAGDDEINIGDTQPAGTTINEVIGDLYIDAGAGAATLNIDDSGETADQSVVMTAGSIFGLSPGAIFFMATGGSFSNDIRITTGAGDDEVTVLGTAFDGNAVTYLNTGDGDDNISIDTLSIVDGLLVVDTEHGNDSVDASSTERDLIIIGGLGSDQLTGGMANDVIVGDQASYILNDDRLQQVGNMELRTGGNDRIDGGGGNNVLLGGAGNDTFNANLSFDILGGNFALVNFDADGALESVARIGTGASDLVTSVLFDLYDYRPPFDFRDTSVVPLPDDTLKLETIEQGLAVINDPEAGRYLSHHTIAESADDNIEKSIIEKLAPPAPEERKIELAPPTEDTVPTAAAGSPALPPCVIEVEPPIAAAAFVAISGWQHRRRTSTSMKNTINW